jgi:hypothetical protein
MTKGARTALFILVATAANILVTAASFILLLVIYGLSLGRVLKIATAAPVILVAFLASILISSLIYKKGLDWARKKWNLEEKLGLSQRKR